MKASFPLTHFCMISARAHGYCNIISLVLLQYAKDPPPNAVTCMHNNVRLSVNGGTPVPSKISTLFHSATFFPSDFAEAKVLHSPSTLHCEQTRFRLAPKTFLTLVYFFIIVKNNIFKVVCT